MQPEALPFNFRSDFIVRIMWLQRTIPVYDIDIKQSQISRLHLQKTEEHVIMSAVSTYNDLWITIAFRSLRLQRRLFSFAHFSTKKLSFFKQKCFSRLSRIRESFFTLQFSEQLHRNSVRPKIRKRAYARKIVQKLVMRFQESPDIFKTLFWMRLYHFYQKNLRLKI